MWKKLWMTLKWVSLVVGIEVYFEHDGDDEHDGDHGDDDVDYDYDD